MVVVAGLIVLEVTDLGVRVSCSSSASGMNDCLADPGEARGCSVNSLVYRSAWQYNLYNLYNLYNPYNMYILKNLFDVQVGGRTGEREEGEVPPEGEQQHREGGEEGGGRGGEEGRGEGGGGGEEGRREGQASSPLPLPQEDNPAAGEVPVSSTW